MRWICRTLFPTLNESQPFMPEDGYVLRKGFEELSARREMVDPVEFQSASEASEGEAASEVGDIIGSIPAGYDRVNFTSDDRAFRDNGKLYTVDEVVWSEDSLRLFFCASGNLYAAGNIRHSGTDRGDVAARVGCGVVLLQRGDAHCVGEQHGAARRAAKTANVSLVCVQAQAHRQRFVEGVQSSDGACSGVPQSD